jgi:hypothetical protein
MPQVTIVKPFTFLHNDGRLEPIGPGTYDMEPELADHWYVQAHSDQAKPAMPKPGMPSYAELYARYQADQDTARMQEEQVGAEASGNARQEFRNQNRRARLRMPGERVPQGEEAPPEAQPAQQEGQQETG